jgi:hypothetical protein
MAKKILETGLGHFSNLSFSINKRGISEDNAVERFKEECNDYSIFSNDGVIVYMTKKEYESIKEKLNL